jgi:diacylglycerol kinase family enzyme
VKPVLLLVNPVAGRGKASSIAPKLIKELAILGIPSEIIKTTEDSRDPVLDQAILDAEVVIAMGGDGTLNRVAKTILLSAPCNDRPRPAVAFVALGTGNVAARAFCFPQRLSDVAELVALKKTRLVDAGIVFQNGVSVAVFLLWLGAGLDAELIHTIADYRSHHRGAWLMPRYFMEMPRLLMTYPFPKINVHSEQINGNFASVMIANVGLLGFGSVTRFADPCDGQFNLIATSPRSRKAWFLSAIMAGMNAYDFCPSVSRSRETDVTLQSQGSVPLQIDGEPFGSPELLQSRCVGHVPCGTCSCAIEIKIRPAALSILIR